jgi:predicted esterase
VSDVIVVREVPAAQQLFLLFHGVGATPDDLVPIGEFLARAFPNSTVASVPAPFPSDFGSGLQWFSVNGVTEANRPARIEQAMPRFVQTVRELQRRFGVKPEATVLAGFSQGAIMALESARLGHALAGRVVSLSGRFAQLPDTPSGPHAFSLPSWAGRWRRPGRECDRSRAETRGRRDHRCVPGHGARHQHAGRAAAGRAAARGVRAHPFASAVALMRRWLTFG